MNRLDTICHSQPPQRIYSRNLTGWADATEAIAGRIQKVKDDVIAQTQPKALTIKPKGATLTTAAEAEAYLESLISRI